MGKRTAYGGCLLLGGDVNALVIVDVQNDFCPGGALAVPEGDEVVPVANRLMPRFDLVVATQDWHPADHVSFAANHPGREPLEVIEVDGLEQTLWPVHCVQGTPGASLHRGLNLVGVERVFRKGGDPRVDSYSGFFDNGRRGATGLDEYLKERGVEELYLCGLATNVCVRATALDAVELGYTAYVIEDACRGVDIRPGDVGRAIDDMRREGVRIVRSADVTV